jgi:uncharacterized protein (TIGR04255 family)
MKAPYPNPTILEAICEFHFTSNEETLKNWDGKWFGRLHSKLGENYDMEPKTAKGIIISTTQGKTTLDENVMSINQMLYTHKTNEHLIQLAPWTLTINEIGQYSCWQSFLVHIELAWKSLFSVIGSLQIKRIGMRYINLIPRTYEDSVGEWINKNDLFPKRILDQRKDFFLRCEIPNSENMRLIVTLTEQQTDSDIKPIIFDIDTFIIKNQDGENWNEINNSLSLIHSMIRKEFDDSQTNKLKDYLNQAPKNRDK